MDTTDLLETTLDKLFPALVKLTNYKVGNLPSLRKTIDPFPSKLIYGEVLDFFVEKSSEINNVDRLIRNHQDRRIDISYRLKTEHSLNQKWNKNLGKAKQLREVCNDVIGIRFIVDGRVDEIKTGILNAKAKVDYTIDIIDMHEKTKAVDDGYRAIHLYFRNQPSCFPIEIQFWTFKDALLHFYTHEVIYKVEPETEAIKYSRGLRAAVDALPDKPDDVDLSFETYLYKILRANQGGE